MRIGRSRKKKPLGEEEVAHKKAAHTPDPNELSTYALSDMAYQAWRFMDAIRLKCKHCSHNAKRHIPVIGWCLDCKHECDGMDAFWREFRSAVEPAIAVVRKHGGECDTPRGRYSWLLY